MLKVASVYFSVGSSVSASDELLAIRVALIHRHSSRIRELIVKHTRQHQPARADEKHCGRLELGHLQKHYAHAEVTRHAEEVH